MSMIKIASIFRSIDGEVTNGGAGRFTTFIRFGGCNVRCYAKQGYCDTPHALKWNSHHYTEMTPAAIARVVSDFGTDRVTITGGEPVMQHDGLVDLLDELRPMRKIVSLETNGCVALTRPILCSVDCVVMDLKCPSTGVSDCMIWENFSLLQSEDYVKAVIQDRFDFDWALKVANTYRGDFTVAFGPKWGSLDPATLLDWLTTEKRFDIQLNLQLHKYIWPGKISEPVQSLNDVSFETLTSAEC